MISALIITAGTICMALAASDLLAKINSDESATPGGYARTVIVFFLGLLYSIFGLSTLGSLS